MFDLPERPHRRYSIIHDGHTIRIEILRSLDRLGVVHSAVGFIVVVWCTTLLISRLLEVRNQLTLEGILILGGFYGVFFVVGCAFLLMGYHRAFAKERIEICGHENLVRITTTMWPITRTRIFDAASIREVRVPKSNFITQERPIELYSGKWRYEFALGVSLEGRKEIAHLLKSTRSSLPTSLVDH